MQSSVLGDDAVINAAAVAMAEVRDEQVFVLLRELGKWPSLTGVISAGVIWPDRVNPAAD
jgi:hypothetical protein